MISLGGLTEMCDISVEANEMKWNICYPAVLRVCCQNSEEIRSKILIQIFSLLMEDSKYSIKWMAGVPCNVRPTKTSSGGGFSYVRKVAPLNGGDVSYVQESAPRRCFRWTEVADPNKLRSLVVKSARYYMRGDFCAARSRHGNHEQSRPPGGEIPIVTGSNRRFSWLAMEYKL